MAVIARMWMCFSLLLLLLVFLALFEGSGRVDARRSFCGDQLVATDELQTLFSHDGFGDRTYPNNLNCYLDIVPKDGKGKVLLIFHTFKLQPSKNCRQFKRDYLKVVDMRDVTYYCGKKLPWPILSYSSSGLHLEFRTDDSNGYAGFAMVYIRAATEPSEDMFIEEMPV